MSTHPAAVVLLVTSLLATMMLVGTLPSAVDVLRHWDLSRSDEAQLRRERRVELVSAIVALVLVAVLASLATFVLAADRIATQLVGAMCAAGALNASPAGHHTLALGVAVFFVASAWLVAHAVNRRGFDYPLVRAQHALLFALAPLVAAYGATMHAYFRAISPAAITSCCSTLFDDASSSGLSSDLASLDPALAIAMFAALAVVLGALGVWVFVGGRGTVAFTITALATFGAAIALTVSVLAPYAYEHPHHHCPYCLLKGAHGFVGWALYGPTFAGAALSLGVAIAGLGRRIPSLSAAGPRLVRRYAAGTLVGFASFTIVAIAIVARSHLVLFDEPFVAALTRALGGR